MFLNQLNVSFFQANNKNMNKFLKGTNMTNKS